MPPLLKKRCNLVQVISDMGKPVLVKISQFCNVGNDVVIDT